MAAPSPEENLSIDKGSASEKAGRGGVPRKWKQKEKGDRLSGKDSESWSFGRTARQSSLVTSSLARYKMLYRTRSVISSGKRENFTSEREGLAFTPAEKSEAPPGYGLDKLGERIR